MVVSMKRKQMQPGNMDEYIAEFPRDVRGKLQKTRLIIRKAAPEAEETIKYQIPTFTLHGNLISFAAFKNHIGIYPAPRGTATFQKDLSRFRRSKSTMRFPLDTPIPFGLIGRAVRFRVREHLAKVASKGKKR